jgi:large repetitive protein
MPADTAGLHNIQVTTPNGTSAKVAAGGFTYEVAPTVTGVSPNVGPTAGGTNVTVTGTGFTGATSVIVGGIGAKNVVVVNDSTITATMPADTAGLHNIQVTAPGGASAKVAADGFTYS